MAVINKPGIYALICPVDGITVRYVGQSCKSWRARANSHLRDSTIKNNPNYPLYRWVNKLKQIKLN